MENFEACLMITRSRLKILKHQNTATDNKQGNGEKCPMVFFLQEIDLGSNAACGWLPVILLLSHPPPAWSYLFSRGVTIWPN